MIGASLTFPFLQAQRDKLSCDALCYGSMQSARSALNMIGTFMIGRLSDRLGRSKVLWIGTSASLFSYGINLYSDSITMMWLSMIPSALLNQNFSVMKALFADYSHEHGYSESERAAAIGKLGMSAGLSFMIGPVLGASLITSYTEATLAAIAFNVISGILLINLPVPKSSTEKLEDKEIKENTASITSFKAIKEQVTAFLSLPVLQTPGAKVLLAMRCCMALAFNIFMVVWTVSLKSRFSFGPKEHAYFMGWIGLCYALSQGFLARWLIKLSGEDPTLLLQVCVICLSGGRVLAMMTTSLVAVYVVMGIVIVALGVMNTAISSGCSRIAGKDQVGGLYGVTEAVESLAGLIGPTLGGVLQRINPNFPIISVVATYLMVLVLVSLYYRDHVIRVDVDADGNPIRVEPNKKVSTSTSDVSGETKKTK